MARYGKKTSLTPLELIEKAVEFFRDSMRLEISERTDEIVCFESELGYVTITACSNDQTDVELETREYDYDVRKFMEKL